MAKLNTKPDPAPREFTHEGAEAARINTMQALRRSVASCLLWEDGFYEDGQTIADRIKALAAQVKPAQLAALAIEAREVFNLRHVPLMLCAILAKTGAGTSLVSETIARVIQRADELSEFVAIYAQVNGVKPSAIKPKLSSQVRKGLAKAFSKFDEYALAKYNRDAAVKLKDVLFLAHPKPKDGAQDLLWKRLIAGTLATPDTWEVQLSAGKDKRETFERLIKEGKLGYFALIRNLRNMTAAGVNRELVRNAILARQGGAHRVLPFRFLAAAKEAPEFERELDQAMIANFSQLPKLPGKTIIILDVSGSMRGAMSRKSTMSLLDAGASLAAVARGQCEDAVIYATAGNDGTRIHKTKRVPARDGMALRDALARTINELGGGGIFLKPMLDFVREQEKTADRIIVITDEQDCAVSEKDKPTMATPFGTRGNYLINVASAKNGVGYGKWTHIDGFSDSSVRFIVEAEKAQ